jgi:urate oxidase
MASSVTAQWLHTDLDTDWSTSYDAVLTAMTSTFADHYSLALQQTLYAMGEAIIDAQPEIAEVRFSMPNKHHFVIDLSPFGLENKNEVFHADDRPYGYIEGTIRRDDAPDPGPAAFDPGQGW